MAKSKTKHFALESIIYRGHQYEPGEEIPVDDTVPVDDAIDRGQVEQASKASIDAGAVAEATDDDGNTAGEDAPNYKSETVKTLTAIAEQRGLDLGKRPKKSDIVAALEASDAASD